MARPRKPAEVHIAQGTYREDRHGEPAFDMPVLLEAIKPSAAVPKSVHTEWRMVTQRLVSLGILIDADLPLLESAFVLLADARYHHELIERAKTTIEDTSEELSKDLPTEKKLEAMVAQAEALKALVSLNGMQVKALSLFSSIASKFAISPSERARILHMLPKKKDDVPKKSIRAVLKK